jgi:hypothetical protein
MTKEDRELLSVFYVDNKVDENGVYIFEMGYGDSFKVEYYGQGVSDINPLTGEDESFYAMDFLILEMIKDESGNYCKDAVIEISKYNYPIKITKLK